MTSYNIPGLGVVAPGTPFRLGDVKYPANWLDNPDAEWLTEHGVTPVEPPAPEPYQPTVDDVVGERARRLALGFEFDFGDARGVHHIGTTPEDMVGWDEVAKASQAFIALGAPATEITIVTGTGPAVITALEFQQILAAAAVARQPLWAASFALQAMDPIPADYDDNSYWE
ncbi:MAG: hypothetical protein AB7S70_00655 [Hyphomicrobium sp.]|uniref:hypothetical protein n=1 Tax=Hyphomicrobium sp. TaxID=82 RepID=UPI003D0BA28F